MHASIVSSLLCRQNNICTEHSVCSQQNLNWVCVVQGNHQTFLLRLSYCAHGCPNFGVLEVLHSWRQSLPHSHIFQLHLQIDALFGDVVPISFVAFDKRNNMIVCHTFYGQNCES